MVDVKLYESQSQWSRINMQYFYMVYKTYKFSFKF